SFLLSCLVVLVGSLAWTASAAPSEGDQRFNSELTRLKNIYGSDSVTQFTRFNNVPELITFFEKYGDRLQLTPEERQKANDALRQYKEERAKQPLVEEVPAQGFWLLVIPPVVEILAEMIKKAAGL
ncbi:hypothetical protein KR200_006581, partial [Drosophila serrata]